MDDNERCRGCGTPFGKFARQCPQCGSVRWQRLLGGYRCERNADGLMTKIATGPSWFNQETREHIWDPQPFPPIDVEQPRISPNASKRSQRDALIIELEKRGYTRKKIADFV